MYTAKEARQLSLEGQPENELMAGLEACVRSAIAVGDTSCNYFTDGHHLSDAEIDYVRGLGYTIYWNGPCLWYEVSW